MEKLIKITMPDNDEFANLLRAYEDAKRALMDCLYRESLTARVTEDAASGN